MPTRRTATLRSLRTTEAVLAHQVDRDKAHTRFAQNVDCALRCSSSERELRTAIEQAQSELDTSLRVAQRHFELAMQQLQTISRFPDEDPE